MHGKLDTSRAKGLKQSEIKSLNRLLQQRIPENKILTYDMAEMMAAFTYETGLGLIAVLNRRGNMVTLAVGNLQDTHLPGLKDVRTGPGRLSGHRVIYSVLTSNGDSKKIALGKEALQCLARNRLDLIAAIDVNPQGTFSRKQGQSNKLIDCVHLAHLLPERTPEGHIWKLEEPQTLRRIQEDDFNKLISALEDEFRRRAPGLQIPAGEERAILVGLITEGMDAWQIEDDLDELAQLTKTAGATVCGRLTQARLQPEPRLFLGSGKVQELALLVQEMGANLIVVDWELSAHQQQNLEKAAGVKVVDRTELILDIFAQRANTREGKLQVELAQLQYLFPRLVGKGIALSRLGGGIGTRGPGETKLEVDRRRLRARINLLEKETIRIRSYRDTQRRKRISEGMPVVALTGYTNSGKSTLLNAITKSEALVEDKLFATLDPATRRTVLPDNSPVLFTDTVGFIKKLPTTLIAAFGATLEEVSVADILMHVVDASHPNVLEHISSVHDVLSELGANDKPMITVLNKADQARMENLTWLSEQLPNPVIVSAKERTGLGRLMEKVQELLRDTQQDLDQQHSA